MDLSDPLHRTTRRDFLSDASALAAGAVLVGRAGSTRADDRLAIVDCHTHFYDPARPEGVPWPGKDDQILYRTVLPKHFLEQAAGVGVTQTVVVEASPWVEDNAWLLQLTEKNPSIVGVVGNLAPGRPEFVEQFKRFGGHKAFRGIRVGHDAVRKGIEQPAFLADMKRLAERGLELDVNGGPETPLDVARLAEEVPDLTIVINHLANVDVDGGPAPKEWLAGMRTAAKHRHVFCKVSALVEHARPKSGEKRVPETVEFYKPMLDAIWETFGDERLIFGSNWPVSERFAPYATVFRIVNEYVTARGRAAADKYFRKNALAAYRWRE